MRLVSLFLLSFVMMGISSAQDTNFPVGPQYLMTLDNPLVRAPDCHSISFSGWRATRDYEPTRDGTSRGP